MTCEWRDRIDRFVDGELPEQDLSRMNAHLQSCHSCAAEALGRMQVKRSIHLAATRAFVPSAEFRARVSKEIGVSQKRTFAWLPQVVFATAMVVMLAIALGVLARNSQRPDILGEVADMHVTTLASASPVDVVSTDRHTVKPWFEGKLPFTFDLPDLQNTEFHLVGGRMAYIGQSPGAQLLFAIRKHQISVFIFQERDALASSLGANSSAAQRLNFNLESWSDRGLRYLVISDANSGDVQSLSDLLHRHGQ
jgi:anti-sigma factor RsiW